MRPIVTDLVAWSVCLSVCHSCDPCKTAKPNEMPYGLWARVNSRNHVLDAGPDCPMRRDNFGGKHVRACLARLPCEACKNGWTDRDAVWTVDSDVPKEAGVTWRCTLAPRGKYDWSVHVQWQCGLSSNYFDHVFIIIIVINANCFQCFDTVDWASER